MRIIVRHTKGREEAARIVDDSIANLLQTDIPKPFRMAEMRKQWTGSTLQFQTAVTMGPLRMPIHGVVQVTDTEVIIDIELPSLLRRFIPEHKLQEAVEGRIRANLAKPAPESPLP